MKNVLVALLTLVVFGAQAQGSLGKSDPEAKKILDAVSAKFKTFKSVQAVFTLKAEGANGKVQGVKKGNVLMKGNKYRVSITGQEIFCDSKTMWTFDKAANEVQVSKVEANGATITPQKLFTNFYDKDFLYKLNGEKKEAGKTLQEIELTPVDKSKPFFKVYVWVDKNAKTLYSTKVMEKAGNKYTYTVNSLTPNAPAADAQFVFDAKKFPGVEVIDLR